MDPADEATLAEDLAEAIEESQHLGRSTAVLMALVDGAFDVGGQAFPRDGHAQPLYHEGRWANLREAGPWLIPLPSSNEEGLAKGLRILMRHCRGRPMLSFLSARVDAQEAVRHFRRFIAPEIEGMDATLLRFADTRVSAALPKALSTQHWRQLTSPLQHWWIVGRDGHLLDLLPGANSGQADVPDEKAFRLSEAELADLVEAGLPDALIHTMAEQLPEFLPNTDRAAFHSLMQQVVQLAKNYAVESYPDQYALAVLAATEGVTTLTSRKLLETLSRKGWPPGGLAAWLLETT